MPGPPCGRRPSVPSPTPSIRSPHHAGLRPRHPHVGMRRPARSPSAAGVPALVLALLAVLLLLLTPGWPGAIRPAVALYLRGSGVELGSGLVQEWAKAYGYERDDIYLRFGLAVNQTHAKSMYDRGLSDFFTSFVAVDTSTSDPKLLQVPMAGVAMVPAYRLSSTAGDASALRFDADVLGRIWAGQITNWNHSDIAALNPSATLPADLPITLVFSPTEELSGALADAFKQALAAISPPFALALSAHGSSLVNVLNAVGVTNYRITNASERVSTIEAVDGALGYAILPEIRSPASLTVKVGMMRYNATVTVTASSSSVIKAMNNFTTALANTTNGGINIFNPRDPTAWPLSTLLFVSMRSNRTIPGKTIACQYIEETLLFLGWTQLNDRAVAISTTFYYASMPFSYRRKAALLFEDIFCDGQKTLTTGLIVGSGAANDVYPPLAYKYQSSTFQFKYYGSTTQDGIDNMVNANFDFGIISSSLPDNVRNSIPDIAGLPITAMAIVPIYHLPELVGRDPLVLSLPLLGEIYLGNVLHWDDPAILSLNPELNGTLPHQPIRLVYQNFSSVITTIYSKAFAFSNPAFNLTVGYGPCIDFPAKGFNTTTLLHNFKVTETVSATPYSLTPWVNNIVSLERDLAVAKLRNIAGKDVAISQDTITSALNDLIGKGDNDLINAPSPDSWPVLSLNSIIIRQSSMTDCNKASLLLDWIYWTQNSTEAINQIIISGMGVVSSSDIIRRQMYRFLASVECQGDPSSSLYHCITTDGLLCSDRGNCKYGACSCFDGFEGPQCQYLKSDSGSTDAGAIVIGIAVPLATVVFLILLCIIIALLAMLVFKRKKRDDWEIDFEELQLGYLLGTGGYGEVYKAEWKGTEVAVKTMPVEALSKETIRNFHDEIRVMTALRHPNVVLFMAACTRPPKMAIVMEFMALGSLFDLLHNSLVSEIPQILKVKMVYQAAKGMHFLHSSGIVHRDLKSLNLLLDVKWNVKVSDFGLTKFKADLDAKRADNIVTIQWAAPEVLTQNSSVDYTQADVYSFGIILWEVLTREQPYYGMSPAAVAVSVIRDRGRPPLPYFVPPDYGKLITACWSHDPAERPPFFEIMTRLATMIEESTSRNSRESKADCSKSSWTLPSSHGSGRLNDSLSSQDILASTHAPEGEVAIVVSDITSAASLWATCPSAMRDATLLHNRIIRELIPRYDGYEAIAQNMGEGSFCVIFEKTSQAVEWCMDVQNQLLAADWPEEILGHPGAAEETSYINDQQLYCGLRVRMGVHVGVPKLIRDPLSRRYEYAGPPVSLTAQITALAHGGQILLSGSAYAKVRSGPLVLEENRIQRIGDFDLPDQPQELSLYEVKIRDLEGRFFGGESLYQGTSSPSACDSGRAHSPTARHGSDGENLKGKELQTIVGEGMRRAEDNFLTSANLCRWVIQYEEIEVGEHIGTGSYGIVYRGKWKGLDVAVKRIIKQKLDERTMLEFRAEMAFLSELHHPNIVLFVGACVKKPNLAIVTEFVTRGSLKSILESSIKIPYAQRLRMLRSASLGLNYLHSLTPVIIHRDIKPSNLLVDEAWNVKVADFGFARVKEENATMTRCGTPAWTAPEIIRGEKYSEKADVYSFAIVMWQMLTRKQPFAGINFINVTMDVLEKKRPQIPADCPKDYAKMMKKCWHNDPRRRPSMKEMVAFFDSCTGEFPGETV